MPVYETAPVVLEIGTAYTKYFFESTQFLNNFFLNQMLVTGLVSLPTPIQDSLFQQKPTMLTQKRRKNYSIIRRERSYMSKWLNSFRSCSLSMDVADNERSSPFHIRFFSHFQICASQSKGTKSGNS